MRSEMKKEREEEEEEGGGGRGEEKEKRKEKWEREKKKLGKRIRFRREANDHGSINVITVLGKRGCSSVCRKEFSPRFNVHFAWN